MVFLAYLGKGVGGGEEGVWGMSYEYLGMTVERSRIETSGISYVFVSVEC